MRTYSPHPAPPFLSSRCTRDHIHADEFLPPPDGLGRDFADVRDELQRQVARSRATARTDTSSWTIRRCTWRRGAWRRQPR